MTTYSISGNISSGTLDPEKLGQEIVVAGCVTDFGGIITKGDELMIICSVLNQLALDAVVLAHVAYSFSDRKVDRILAIDARTREIINGGFSFDGHMFSLSTQAQTNWLGLISLQSLFTWPMGITDNANTTYELSQANVTPFVATGCGTIAGAIGSGRALKIACNAAATQAELDAVVDTR